MIKIRAINWLFVIFVILFMCKVSGWISCSWWIVIAPIWLPAAIIVAVAILCAVAFILFILGVAIVAYLFNR
jgi:hypothetical protein